MKYYVLWTTHAANDLQNITDYISKDNPIEALIALDRIEKSANDLYEFPERGRIVPELQFENIFQYRELIVSPWRMIYKISGQNIHILMLLDSRRTIDNIFLNSLSDIL